VAPVVVAPVETRPAQLDAAPAAAQAIDLAAPEEDPLIAALEDGEASQPATETKE